MKRLVLTLMAIYVSLEVVSVSAAGVNFPLGTQIITGSVKNYLNELYSSENVVKVQAADTEGHVLAECDVHDAIVGSDGENYLLEVPVTQMRTAFSIQPGDELRLYVVDGNQLKVAAGTVSSANAFDEIKADLRVINVEKYPSSSSYADQKGEVVVAKEYLDIWAAYSDGKPYSPDADEDGDGASNYFEYLSGTNPFDPSDYLAIKSFKLATDRTAELSFEYVGGHVYSVLTSESLADPKWAKEKTVLFATTAEEPGITTITVLPTEATSRFYKLDPQ